MPKKSSLVLAEPILPSIAQLALYHDTGPAPPPLLPPSPPPPFLRLPMQVPLQQYPYNSGNSESSSSPTTDMIPGSSNQQQYFAALFKPAPSFSLAHLPSISLDTFPPSHYPQGRAPFAPYNAPDLPPTLPPVPQSPPYIPTSPPLSYPLASLPCPSPPFLPIDRPLACTSSSPTLPSAPSENNRHSPFEDSFERENSRHALKRCRLEEAEHTSASAHQCELPRATAPVHISSPAALTAKARLRPRLRFLNTTDAPPALNAILLEAETKTLQQTRHPEKRRRRRKTKEDEEVECQPPPSKRRKRGEEDDDSKAICHGTFARQGLRRYLRRKPGRTPKASTGSAVVVKQENAEEEESDPDCVDGSKGEDFDDDAEEEEGTIDKGANRSRVKRPRHEFAVPAAMFCPGCWMVATQHRPPIPFKRSGKWGTSGTCNFSPHCLPITATP